MNILVNAIGISDSGGATVMRKLVSELKDIKSKSHFTILISDKKIYDFYNLHYINNSTIDFLFLDIKSNFHRLCIENFHFNKIVRELGIDLIYNFTGSSQFFLKTPQLLKIHNLLFYSKKLNDRYIHHMFLIKFIRQIYFKSTVFKYMLKRSKLIEIQSAHVADALSDFIDISKKKVFIKSDVVTNIESYKKPKGYDFNKKIKFLFVVGPHFEILHKNFEDFKNAMLLISENDIDFEIHITLTKQELNNSKLWDDRLNSITVFHGYIDNPALYEKLFCSNTILISTSIVESIGLHVIEAIKEGLITITPNEHYADVVYGNSRYKYELFNPDSLAYTINSIIKSKNDQNKHILLQQKYIIDNENSKYRSVSEIFKEIVNV